MHPRPTAIHLRLSHGQADFLYYELLGQLDHYRNCGHTHLEEHEEAGLLDVLQQLETGLARSTAVANLQLSQLRAAVNRPERRAAAEG